MDPKLKELIEKETGVKVDGKLTTDEILKVYNALKPFIDKVFPNLVDTEDALIDKLEARAMTRHGMRKRAALGALSLARTFLNCPDDDDNITQK